MGHPLPLDTPRLVAVLAGPEHVAGIQACLEGAPGYFRVTERRLARSGEAQELLAEAEADPARGVYAFLFRGADGRAAPRRVVDGAVAAGANGVAGVLDLVLDYPEPGTAQIALLLFPERLQGRGLGGEVVAALERAIADAGFSSLRLAVVDENVPARRFWEGAGFPEIGRLPGGITVYEKALA